MYRLFPKIALATGVLTSSIGVRVRRFWFVLGVGQGVVPVLNIRLVFLCLSCLSTILIRVETCLVWIGLRNCGNGSYLSMLFGAYTILVKIYTYYFLFPHHFIAFSGIHCIQTRNPIRCPCLGCCFSRCCVMATMPCDKVRWKDNWWCSRTWSNLSERCLWFMILLDGIPRQTDEMIRWFQIMIDNISGVRSEACAQACSCPASSSWGEPHFRRAFLYWLKVARRSGEKIDQQHAQVWQLINVCSLNLSFDICPLDIQDAQVQKLGPEVVAAWDCWLWLFVVLDAWAGPVLISPEQDTCWQLGNGTRKCRH